MKRFLVIFLAVAMCLSLVACGRNEEVDSDGGGQSVSDASNSNNAEVHKTESKTMIPTNSNPSVDTPEDGMDQATDVDAELSGSADLNNPIDVGKKIPDDDYSKTGASDTNDEQIITDDHASPEEGNNTQDAILNDVADILAGGGHPYDFGYHYNADDTDRRLSREEYDSWIAAGYNPLSDNYLDREHFVGLY